MKDCYKETVDAVTFKDLKYKRKWSYTMPVRRRYVRFLPPQSFLIGKETCLVLAGPSVIRFRRRWSLETIEKNIRVTYIEREEGKPYFIIHLV